ncbi:hypothetical protein [Bacteroides caecigallinarum]|nr:hypothetical protein [Bacteroides caecigallinarum]
MIHQSMKVLLLLSAIVHAGEVFPDTETSAIETTLWWTAEVMTKI